MSEKFRAKEIQKRYCALVRGLSDRLREFSFLTECTVELRRVADDAVQPFNVAVFGRMKTGKSSLINAIIGSPLAITGVEEATATINRLSYADGEQLHQFTVHWKDAQQETFPIEQLQSDWTGTREDVLARVKKTAFLGLYANVECLKDIHIIDTPGTGSTATEHENIAQQFISGQEADALVYVFPPVGRETDEKDLAEFRKGRLESSDPYNSIAVLHKWDEIYWNNGGDMADISAKASRLREHMKDVVADVVPVSAPLALLVKMASSDFWESCIAMVAGFSREEELKKELLKEVLWNRESGRKELYQRAKSEYGLPWASFRIMLRELFRAKMPDAQSACSLIRKLCGYDEFERILNERIFKHQAVIRLRQTRARAQKCLNRTYEAIDRQLESFREKLGYMERIAEELHTRDLKAWLESEVGKSKSALRSLEQSYTQIDRERLSIKDEMETEDKRLEILRWLDTQQAAPLAPLRQIIIEALESGHLPEGEGMQDKLLNCTAPLLISSSAELRRMAEKLDDILCNLEEP